MILELTIPGQPVPTARPRVTRSGGAFIPARSRHAQARIKEMAEATGIRFGKDPVAIRCTFYGARANSDLDNLAKTVLDGLQKAGTIDDDCHVHLLALTRFNGLPANERRTVVTVQRMP